MILPGVYEEGIPFITGSALKKGKGEDLVIEIYFLVENETATAYLYTTEKAWKYTEKKLIACGYNPADHGYDLAPLNLDGPHNPISGQRPRIVVTEEEFEGKIRSKIGWIGPAEGLTERMNDVEAAQFTDALRKRLLASRGTGKPETKKAAPAKAKPAPKPSVPANRPGETDDPNTWA